MEHYSKVEACSSITIQFNLEGPSGLEGLIKHDIVVLSKDGIIVAYKENKA